jgi:asparagine synthase (glutamine-hydrolysing)
MHCARPDTSVEQTTDSPAVLCHERLSIVGVGTSPCLPMLASHGSQPIAHRQAESGAQPLTNADESIVLAVNGEIYNHRLIRKHLKEHYHFKTTSDCEVVIPLVRVPDHGRRRERRRTTR